ncbi:hypothetical protein ACHAXN_012702 [Cyclotella atomus]
MVNVTKSNFLTSLRDLLIHLPTASYIAIDEEMTGIRINHKKPNKAELPGERYTNSWKGVPERYGILQVGIALFHKNPDYRAKSSAAGSQERDIDGETGAAAGGLGLGAQNEDEAEAQDVIDVNEHPFMHREGTLNQDELEDMTEREEDAAAHPANTDDVPEYTSRIYNFYLFPNSDSQKDVTMSSDTIAFLIENKMDFNKVFSEGISFMSVSRAEELKRKFLEKKAKMKEEGMDNGGESTPLKRSGEKVKLTRTEDIAFVARTMACLREWIDAENGNEENGANGGDDPDTGVGRRQVEGSSLVLPPCNAFLRRCLYETIEAEYPGLVLERADSGPNGGAARNQIRVIRLSMSEKKQREERLLQEEWSKLVYAIGFTTVFQAISDACNGNSFSEEQTDAFFAGNSPRVSVPSDDNGRKIPLIVHNGLMDLMFLLTHCHDSKLPECFEDTKKLIRNYFPLVYDTKILATECSDAVVRGGSTALGDLYQSMFSPEINDLGLKKSTITNGSATEQAHEAAWDAFMTGCCFYALSKKILDNKDSRLTLGRVLEHEPVGSLHRTSMGLNKLYMHFSLYTIDLESSSGTSGLHDPLCHGLTVNTTFYVSGIDSTVSTRDILRALTVTQNQTEIIQHLRYEICWVDDESFFVGTKLDNLISVRDTGAISLIAIHVRHQLRAGLRGVQVIDLADYFNQKHSSKQSLIGSITSAVKRLFGGGKRTEDDDTNERAKKRRRVN